MTHDLIDDVAADGSRRRAPPPAPGRVVVAGVAGACVLGVALGMWARPGQPNEPATREAPAKPSRDPLQPPLRIVIDEAPTPAGAPLEVLNADLPPARPAERRTFTPPLEVEVEPIAPRPAVSGLMKVAAPEADTAPVMAPAIRVAPKPRAEAASRRAKAVAEAPKPVAKARPARGEGGKARVTESKPKSSASPPATRKARLEKAAKADAAAKLARVEKARAGKLRTERAQARKEGPKTETVKATARKEKPSGARGTTLARAERAKAQKVSVKRDVKAAVKPASVRLAKAKAESRPVARPKAQKTQVAKAPPPKPVRKAAPVRPLRGEGTMRVARNDGCGSPDPGEAIVCADSRLSARERQLQQAYRSAEAAGVPASTLRRQQVRWQQARAAAAREAPWAVEDVYVARISELKDQTRDASEE